MATDRDEQQRQQQELEEIRRSFAEMGARMGSLFEPADTESARAGGAARAPTAPGGGAGAAALAAGGRGGAPGPARHLLRLGDRPGGRRRPTRGGACDHRYPDHSAEPDPSTPPETVTVPSVPEQCVETAELADEVISRLNRNIRDERLFLALRDYTIASQACRREASP